MPSLTPNEDAWAAALISDEIVAETRKPGRDGTIARIIVTLMQCQGVTMAREFDRGADGRDVADGFAQAIGNMIVGIAGSITQDPVDRAHNVAALAERINRQLREILSMPPDELDASAVSVAVTDLARA